jgi:pimeloyl-ACP methyl ester carboxylesterase
MSTEPSTSLIRPDGEIRYQSYGTGYPVLLLAPGGLRSRAEMWHTLDGGITRLWVDWTQALPDAGFTAIAMDQRNAGSSRTAIAVSHGWHTYAADHLALMDHLGFDQFHVLGGCIGASFCLKLIEVASKRVSAAVLQNPIGRHPEHRNFFPDTHVEWGRELRANRPDLTEEAIAGFGQNLWVGDFVFSVDRAVARTCPVSTFLMPGNDIPHPSLIGQELANLLPGVEVLRDWRGGEYLKQQETQVVQFLQRNTSRARR